MKVIILAAGYATRLYPLTLNTPKPLLKIADKPIIDFILDKIHDLPEIDHVYVITNNKFAGFFEQWLAGRPEENTQFDISVINDGTIDNDSRLGPVGDVSLVLEQNKIDDDVLIIAGDNLFDLDITRMYSISQKNGSSVLAIKAMKNIESVRKKYGVVSIDDTDRVMEFEEKPSDPKSTLVATAIYLFRKETLPTLTALSKSTSRLETNAGDMIKQLLINNFPIHVIHLSHWFDIGTKNELAEAENFYHSLKKNT